MDVQEGHMFRKIMMFLLATNVVASQPAFLNLEFLKHTFKRKEVEWGQPHSIRHFIICVNVNVIM